MQFLIVIVAAVVAYAFGAVWYMAMARPWVAAAGIKVDEKGRPQGSGSAMPLSWVS